MHCRANFCAVRAKRLFSFSLVFILLPRHPGETTAELPPPTFSSTRRSGSRPSFDGFGTKHALIVSVYRLSMKKIN
jgi:hypothetical protein